MSTIGELVVRIVADIGDLATTLDAGANALDAFARRASDAGRAMQSAGILITTAGAALVAPLALAVREAASFETGLRNANTVMGLSDQALREVGKEVLALSQQLPQSARDLSNALFFIAGSGIEAAKQLGVLRQSAQAATAGITTTESAAKIIVTALNAYGQENITAAQASDILFQTVNKGVVTFEELAAQFGEAIAFGAALGVPLKDLGAAMATITLAGFNAAESTTALTRLMVALATPTDTLQALFRSWGVETGRQALASFGLAGVVAKLDAAIGDNDVEIQKTVGEMRAWKAIVALTANDMQNFTRIQADFADVSGATERAFAQQAQTFDSQFKVLKNNIAALATSIGTQLLPTLNAFFGIVVRVLKVMSDWAQAHPTITKAIGLLVGGFGIFLGVLGAGLLTVGSFLILIGKIPGLLRSASLGLEALAVILPSVAQGFAILRTAIAALTAILAANPIGLLIAAIGIAIVVLGGLVIRNWDAITDAFKSAFARIGLLVRGFLSVLGAIPLALSGQFAEARESLQRGIGEIKQAFTGAEEGVQAFAGAGGQLSDRLRDVSVATEGTTAALKDHKKSVEEIEKTYQAAATAAEVFGLRQQAASAQVAAQRLQAPGLTEADFTAVAEAQERANRAAQEQQLQSQISAQQEAISQLAQLGTEGAEKRAEGEKNLAQLTLSLENVRLESVRTVAKAIVDAEKAAASERIKAVQTVRTETIAAARTASEAQIAAGEASLARFRLQEETRIGLLGRTVGTLRGLSQSIIDGSEALNRILTARDEASLEARAKTRARLVAEGALLEQDAEQANASELLAIRLANAQRGLQAEEQRLAMARTINQVEVGFAIAEGRSKIAVIQAEAQARISGLRANQQLRIADLEGALAAANAEKEARLDVIRSEVAARAAAGQLTQAEAAAITSQIDSIQQGFAATTARIRADAQASLQATANAQAAIEQETAARTLGVQTETQARVAELAQQEMQNRITSAERVQGIEKTLNDALIAERERLASLGLTEGQIDAQLKPAQTVLDRLKALGTEQVGLVQQALTTLSTAYQAFSQQILGFLQPVIDAMKLLANPELLRQLLTPQGPQAPLQPGAPRGTLPPVVPGQPSGMIVNVNGATVNLTADESAVVARVLAAVLGPEGNRWVADWLRAHPGPRILPA